MPISTALWQRSRLYPWLVISLCSLFLVYKYLLQMSPSVMTAELMREFDITGAGLGNLAATLFYAYMITQLFVGPLLDQYSPRLLTSLALALCAISVFIFSAANSLVLVLLSRALVGVGVAFATVSYMKLATIWFKPSQFALVSGLLVTAAMVGSLAAETPLAFLVSIVGWRSSLFFCGVFGIVLAALFYAIVRDHNPSQALNVKPGANKITLKDFYAVLKLRCNWHLMCYSGLAFSPLAVFGGLWGNPFLQAMYGITREGSATLVSMIFLGLAIGSPLLGLLSDHFAKRFFVMMSGLILSLITLLLSLYCMMPLWLLGTCLFCFGFGTGGFMLAFALGRQLNNPLLAATVVALINTGDALVGAISEPMVGKILDLLWNGQTLQGIHVFSVSSYHLALAMLPAYLLLAVFFLFALRKKCH